MIPGYGDINWMMTYLGTSQRVINNAIKNGEIPPYQIDIGDNKVWNKIQIMDKFPHGWHGMPPDGVRLKWMLEYFTVGRTKFYELISVGIIPKPIKYHRTNAHWIKKDIISMFPNGLKDIDFIIKQLCEEAHRQIRANNLMMEMARNEQESKQKITYKE